MAALMRQTLIPLPKAWPLRVRSAVIHTISLSRTSLIHTRSWAANHFNARIRLKEEDERLRNEISLLQEESRIKDARMGQTPAQRRPHYPPVERLAIRELRAARGWSLQQTAARFLVTPLTIASWNSRLDEEGADALVRMPVPVNKFPEFVGYLVQRLKVVCPTMGKTRIANVLCRAGLHLGSTTVHRMLRETESSKPPTPARSTGAGRVCRRRRIQHRFGAVGGYGSIAVVERLMRTIKNECKRRLVRVPFRRADLIRELSLWTASYNADRPHEALVVRTPDEIYFHRRPACRSPRFEPRSRWRRRAPCAGPHALVRGRPGVRVDLDVRYAHDQKHLPIVALSRAA